MTPPEPLALDNPLFDCEQPPRFDVITPADVVPGVTALIERQNQQLAALESRLRQGSELNWENVMGTLQRLAEPLSFAWNVVHHLLSLKNSAELRQAEEAMQPLVVEAALRLSQSQPVYQAMVALRDGPTWSGLNGAQLRIVTLGIRLAEQAGVGLTGEARARFTQVQMHLAEAATKFSNHLLDATKAFAMLLTDPAEVAGLPTSLLAAAAQSARQAAPDDAVSGGATPEAGPWRITLDGPIFLPFMEHAERRDLRERLYRAQITRASQGELNNQPVLEDILKLRQEEAQLLGYGTFAELSLSRKMAQEVRPVERLLEELRRAALPFARRDLDELTAFARQESSDPQLNLRHWDIAFWAERLRERRYDYSDEALRPYFPLPQVLEGLFDLAGRLFGVTIAAADGEVPVWHPDVRFFRVVDEAGAPRAAFYLDPYSRPADKRGGAWMNGCLDRKRRPDGTVRLPMTFLVCNISGPVDGQPSLMTFREVETLFHEFGHGLQHMLTTVDYPDAAGTSGIEWDAVELPSQFMENWCYHRPTLLSFARHFQTGQPLPGEMYDRIVAARNFRAGSLFLRQIYFATLDLELHDGFDPAGHEPLQELVARVAAANTVLPPLPEDRFLCSFSHIFAGGYAAGYYSYKWAEVLSADAFGAFEEAGLDDPAALARIGRRFRDTVLALGGSEHPAKVFESFRGRAPNTSALLRHSGLNPTS